MYVRVLGAVGIIALRLPAASAVDWPMYLLNPEHSSFNRAESLLTPAFLPSLRPAWTLSLNAGLAAAPTVVDGILYFGDWNGSFYAVRASDGVILWRQFVGKAPDPENPDCMAGVGVSAQAAVAGSTVYVGGGDSAVYALDRTSGALQWRLALAEPESGAYIWSSLTLVDNVLYVGLASLGDCPLVRGLVARIDLADLNRSVIRYLAPENQVGAGVWSTPAVDPSGGTVYVTTGTGEQDSEAGMWGGTLASLDARTLEVKSYFFLPSNSVEEDIEWGSSPMLFEPPSREAMVGATGKDGVLYALRAADLTLAWQTKLAVECICPECGCGSLSTPAFDGRTLFVGAGVRELGVDANGSVYALDPATGAVIWVRDTAGVVIAPVTVANGMVFASTTAGLVVFDAAGGDLLWSETGHGALYSQPVVVDGAIFCTYTNGDVVAWRLFPPA